MGKLVPYWCVFWFNGKARFWRAKLSVLH